MNVPTIDGGVPTGGRGPEDQGKDPAPKSKRGGDADQPGPLAELTTHANLLCLAPVERTFVYLENEHLSALLREW